jgi:UDPglucose 6-dehydrogenase
MSFKPDTDDTRNAPAITIMNNLVNLGAKVRAYDPVVKISPGELISQVIICQSYEELFEAADLVILATEWKEFKVINYAELRKMMRDTYFIDGRNALIKEDMISLGYKYFGIGR